MTSDGSAEVAAAVRDALGPALVAFDAASIYEWAPVFRATVRTADGDVAVKVKRTWRDPAAAAELRRWLVALGAATDGVVAPVQPLGVTLPITVGDVNFTCYRWVEGRTWDVTGDDLRAVGRLLGGLHAAAVEMAHRRPAFAWPSRDDVDDRVDAVTLVVFENTDVAPRLFDLALTAPLFFLEAPCGPKRSATCSSNGAPGTSPRGRSGSCPANAACSASCCSPTPVASRSRPDGGRRPGASCGVCG